MKSKLIPVLAVMLGIILPTNLWAQANDSLLICATAYDDFTHAGIKDSKAYLMTRDSVVIDSCVAIFEPLFYDKKRIEYGGFRFHIKKNKSLRECIVKVVHPNYHPVSRSQSLRYLGKVVRLTIPSMFMKRRNTFLERNLDNVTVTATKVKFFYNGDTLVYNADAFNVADGSMLDALIKQLPGVELTREGEIFVNDRKVEHLLLNGKNFFSGKRKLMLENLPYYTVKDIKVYDKTTDKAAVLRDDDEEKEYVMDVNLKREYSKGYIANVEAGAGTEDTYLARLFGLRFTDHTRFSIVGGLNNVNESTGGTQWSWYNGLGRNGRTEAKSVNVEYLFENQKKKNTLTVSGSDNKSESGADVFYETFQGSGVSTFGMMSSKDTRRNRNVSAKNVFRLKVPFWFESVTQLNYGHEKSTGHTNEYESMTDTRRNGYEMLDSLFNLGVSVNDPLMQNARRRLNSNKDYTYKASQDVNTAYTAFNSDIIDIKAGVNYSKTDADAERNDLYFKYRQSSSRSDVVETIDRPSTLLGVKADLSYDFKHLFLNSNFKVFLNYRYNRESNSETITDMLSSNIDAQNSFHRRMNENILTGGFNYRYKANVKEIGELDAIVHVFDLTVPCTYVRRTTDYSRFTLDTCVTQSPFYIEPTLTLNRKKEKDARSKASRIKISTAGSWDEGVWTIGMSTSLRYSITDPLNLITLPLTSDRINIYEGNEHLKNSKIWTTRVHWNVPLGKETLHHDIVGMVYFDRVISTYRYDSGVYTHKPENINGTWTLESKLNSRFELGGIRFTWKVNNTYSRMKNFVADGTSGKSQQVDNDELHTYVPLSTGYISFVKNIFYTAFSASFDWRKALSKDSDMGYRDAMEYCLNIDNMVRLPRIFDIESKFVARKRMGYSNDDINRLSCEWNVTMRRSVFNKKIDLKLTAVDLLRQYKAVTYVTNERGIRETRALSLPAYVMMTATYKFNKNPKKN